MMKIKVRLSIGYPTACQEDVLDIPDSDLEGLNETERDDAIMECVQEWANNYIDYGYTEVKR